MSTWQCGDGDEPMGDDTASSELDLLKTYLYAGLEALGVMDGASGPLPYNATENDDLTGFPSLDMSSFGFRFDLNGRGDFETEDEHATWTVSELKVYPATRYEPEEVVDIPCVSGLHSYEAAEYVLCIIAKNLIYHALQATEYYSTLLGGVK